ncbi:MAG: hypothetical protein SFV19_00755 [Rhodospirillaceae bacterium]|nr:hypothetical protein [Rhodospirillaceae bacterium]
MSTQASAGAQRGPLAGLMDPPYLGLLIFATILLYKPVAHTLLVLQHIAFTGPEKYLVGFLVGLLGFTLVGKGLRQDDLTATAMGWMGGALIWMGWFEYAFDFFGEATGAQPLMVDGNVHVPPNLVILEATAVPFLAMLALFGANRETRCRLLMWFHRNLRLAPPKPTQGYKRSYAWVTALETIFVTWAFYLMIIVLYDPRVAGLDSNVTAVAFWVFLAWGGYLTTKLVKHNEPAAAIRYAIPTTNAFWIAIEMGAHWGWFTEIWVKPLQYPVACAAFMVAFALGAVVVVTRGQAGARQPLPAE